MENTFNQMAELGGSDERLGTNTTPIINAPLLPMNTRPAAPVSELETVETQMRCLLQTGNHQWRNPRLPSELSFIKTNGKDETGIPYELRELVTRSQAEYIIAAKVEQERLRFEGDLDKWMKIIGAGITGYQPEAYALMDLACQELVNLRADNAALTARVKELEHDLNGAKGNAKNALSDLDYWRGQYEALKAENEKNKTVKWDADGF
jgi:hypothetical protein